MMCEPADGNWNAIAYEPVGQGANPPLGVETPVADVWRGISSVGGLAPASSLEGPTDASGGIVLGAP